MPARPQLDLKLAKFAIKDHKISNRGKIKEKILCPCLNCQRWRKSFLRSGIYTAIQKVIRKTVKENIRVSREIDKYLHEC